MCLVCSGTLLLFVSVFAKFSCSSFICMTTYCMMSTFLLLSALLNIYVWSSVVSVGVWLFWFCSGLAASLITRPGV